MVDSIIGVAVLFMFFWGIYGNDILINYYNQKLKYHRILNFFL